MSNTNEGPTHTGPERRESGRLYGRTATEVTGTLQDGGERVRYRDALTPRQRRGVLALGWFHVVLALALAGYLLLPSNLPRLGHGVLVDAVAVGGLVVMVVLQLIAGLRTWTITYHAEIGRAHV